jgi:hypothetical protein
MRARESAPLTRGCGSTRGSGTRADARRPVGCGGPTGSRRGLPGAKKAPPARGGDSGRSHHRGSSAPGAKRTSPWVTVGQMSPASLGRPFDDNRVDISQQDKQDKHVRAGGHSKRFGTRSKTRRRARRLPPRPPRAPGAVPSLPLPPVPLAVGRAGEGRGADRRDRHRPKPGRPHPGGCRGRGGGDVPRDARRRRGPPPAGHYVLAAQFRRIALAAVGRDAWSADVQAGLIRLVLSTSRTGQSRCCR